MDDKKNENEDDNESKMDEGAVIEMKEEIEIDFSKQIHKLDSFSMKKPLQFNKFNKLIQDISIVGSNASHQMQNFAAPFIRLNPGNQEASNIVKICGQMENQWRAIQSQIYNYSFQYNTHPNKNHLTTNLCNQIKKQLDNIDGNLDKITKTKSNIINLDDIMGIEGSMQILVGIFKNNIQLQFGI